MLGPSPPPPIPVLVDDPPSQEFTSVTGALVVLRTTGLLSFKAIHLCFFISPGHLNTTCFPSNSSLASFHLFTGVILSLSLTQHFSSIKQSL